MAKDRHDKNTDDRVDDAEERRFKEEQEHARRQARKDKLRERSKVEEPLPPTRRLR